MIDHVSVAVSDLSRADRFYTAVLAPLGLARLRNEPTRIGFGKTYAEFWINHRPGVSARDKNGAHVALRARDADSVAAFHRAAVEHGAADDGAPGPRERGAGPKTYYAAFIIDADGNCIEAVAFLD